MGNGEARCCHNVPQSRRANFANITSDVRGREAPFSQYGRVSNALLNLAHRASVIPDSDVAWFERQIAVTQELPLEGHAIVRGNIASELPEPGFICKTGPATFAEG